MIGHAVIGRGFGGALNYALAAKKGYLLDTNMAGETARELAAEFSALRDLRPNLHRVVLHASLSLAPGETLDDAQWREIGQRYLHGMGFTDNQYVLIRHTDTAHEHVPLDLRVAVEEQDMPPAPGSQPDVHRGSEAPIARQRHDPDAAHPLAPAGDQVTGQRGDQRDLALHAFQDHLVDRVHA